MTKGTRIDQFLESARRELYAHLTVRKVISVHIKYTVVTLSIRQQDFHELRAQTVDGLIYVKEDLIIPHHYSFYDFIVTRARGKSGPLFHFDVHDDIRLVADTRVEKDESHAGKILTRNFYERNQHVFPYNRWEVVRFSVCAIMSTR